MFIPLVVVVLATMAALVRGGSLDNLARTKFAWTWVLFLGLAAQVVFDVWAPVTVDKTVGLAITLGSIGCVLFFLIANRHLAGTVVASVGLALNAIVIAANGAMPVSVSAARSAGIEPSSFDQLGIKHELMGDSTRLSWLADIFFIPDLEKVFSVGDVVLAVGLGMLVYACTVTRPEERDLVTRPAASG